MQRRNFLKSIAATSGLALASNTLMGTALIESFFISSAHGQSIPLQSLRSALNPAEATVLVPTDANFAKYQIAFNKRMMKTPTVRVLCNTPQAVVKAIQWAKANNVPLAMRAGGHSYEGFSQSTGMVIDVRPMNQLEVSADRQSILAGSGVQLGNLYQALAPYKLALPAGSCPTVGATGHTLGGGYGLLARPLGLACDSLLSAEIVTADGRILTASETENADLFWALRGAGGGSYGVVTKLHFKTHPVSDVLVFSMGWQCGPKTAAALLKTWQAWAPNSPKEITSLMKTSRDKVGNLQIRCVGLSLSTEAVLRKELSRLATLMAPTKAMTITPKSFIDSVHHFAGNEAAGYPSVYQKAKSDYIEDVMTDDTLALFMKNIPTGPAVIFDSYGGAIRNKSNTDTAFFHREKTVSSMQYTMEWADNAVTERNVKTIRTFYDSLRSHMPNYSYVNYCDLDLKDFERAYWGTNITRLKEIKSAYDPGNFFKHAQSIGLKT